MKPNAAGAGMTVGGSLAYLIVTIPTLWLEVLPLIPEPHFLPVVGSLGAVISAILILIFGKKRNADDKE